jgi:glycosyltransferase involved in cell wall biosynthesis
MAWYSARRADRVIAISEATRRDVIKFLRVAPERVTRVYCGVDARFHPFDDGDVLRRFREDRHLPDHFVLYLGTIEPRKNLVRLIDAYADLRRRGTTDWPLVLAGGRGWRDELVLQHADRLGLGEAVRFAGFVPEDEIPLWYNAADFFVYPSEYEGFGLPPLEALACGTPVVASNRASLPEVLDDAAILVDPADTHAIADGMERLLADSALRSRLSAAGPLQASGFSWRAMAEETLNVYRAVNAGQARR